MFSRLKIGFYVIALAFCVLTGWACSQYSKAGISSNQVVATVGGQQITFGQWMQQLDLLRVFDTPVDPNDAQQVKAVLETLINQQLILEAAQKANYSDPNFDEYLKNKLLQADMHIKDQKQKLEEDLAAIKRVENNYQDAYKKILLARSFAADKVGSIPVSEAELKTWYKQYSAQAEASGQKMKPYSTLTSDIKNEIKQNIQAEKFLDQLQASAQVTRNDDVIQKYLNSLSPSPNDVTDGQGDESAAPPAAPPQGK